MTQTEHKELNFYKSWCVALSILVFFLFVITCLTSTGWLCSRRMLESPEIIHCHQALEQCNTLNEVRRGK